MNKVFVRGLLTGLILQLAIGPVFIFIMNTVFQKGIEEGILAVIAVTIADYIYIILAIFGVGKLLEKTNIRNMFVILSSVALVIFGIITIKNGFELNNKDLILENRGISSFIQAFMLTLSSPLTIVFWTSIFASKMDEYNLNKKEIIIFGLACGLATLLFLGVSVVIFSWIKIIVSNRVMQFLNFIVGALLLFYGIIRIKKIKIKETA